VGYGKCGVLHLGGNNLRIGANYRTHEINIEQHEAAFGESNDNHLRAPIRLPEIAFETSEPVKFGHQYRVDPTARICCAISASAELVTY